MAGTNPAFDGATFRTAIRSVYTMAAPPEIGDQATFVFPNLLVYNKPVDGEDVPFDPTATVTTTPGRSVTGIPCSIEFFDQQGQEVVFGNLTAARVAFTFLDDDYAQVKGFAYVVLGGQKYLYKHTEPPGGLFDVGLFTVHCTAEDLL